MVWWFDTKIPVASLLWLLSSGAGWSELSLPDILAVINSHIAAERFVPWNWIVLLSEKGKNSVCGCLCKHSLQTWRCCSCPPEWDPSVRVSHHHSQTAHRVRGIRGKMLCVVLARSAVVGLSMFHGERVAWHFYVCVCMHLCAFLSSEWHWRWKAMPGLYLLQSSVSIIEEWYLQRGKGVWRRTGGEEWGEGIKQKEGNSYFDELLAYLWYRTLVY